MTRKYNLFKCFKSSQPKLFVMVMMYVINAVHFSFSRQRITIRKPLKKFKMFLINNKNNIKPIPFLKVNKNHLSVCFFLFIRGLITSSSRMFRALAYITIGDKSCKIKG